MWHENGGDEITKVSYSRGLLNKIQINDSENVSRAKLLELLEEGRILHTRGLDPVKGLDTQGEQVHVYEINGVKYIKQENDGRELDLLYCVLPFEKEESTGQE
jgi:hypothetical protein